MMTDRKQVEFIRLLRQQEKMLHKVCRIYTEDEENHKDLLQEITLQLWKGFATFRGESKVSTWVYRVALNTAISFKRKEKSLIAHNDFSIEVPFSEDHDEAEKIKLLYRSINKLHKLDKAIIFLYLEAYKASEISDITGISANNVTTRIYRIKKKLAEEIINEYKIKI